MTDGMTHRAADIRIWMLQLDLKNADISSLVDSINHLLTDVERARIKRFVHKHAAIRFLSGRFLLRCALAAHENGRDITLPEWRFSQREDGKPELVSALAHTGLKFNLSHSMDMVACAVAVHHEVGVDVEYFPENLDIASVAEKCFSRKELANFQGKNIDEMRRIFLRQWTLKEAYVKARGSGLAYPVRSATICRSDEGRISVLDENDASASQHFHFAQFGGSETFSAALCWCEDTPHQCEAVLQLIPETERRAFQSRVVELPYAALTGWQVTFGVAH